ncbi:MAG: cell division protein FtsH [Candidatus Sungbacteria bacterium RIFCSPLOWO2_01_FULL_54_21]|uniref:ATP-dependent zinc metalloprotease FtsH n=2 Tax=Candidatus Sungiibacteriota TaxID=1817917 RepID=A0A1G2L7E8_9BACT|nr:MAG: cell division protein FtsH [Candidatus Sungbacteria bacterium RIFCSPHIGHO2_01_FULL_54_26]OHA03552.1 MAG: cell division protein FtsH [Candidatus Sungbacteria bacterium RIFCSPHIGHO2_02_FULL_53_17]OHA07597.1 MAG: cell division protein FtsH [Candidatus Sungbacteria bacterium RIFCSPLOWO2_01_FULL_54_21]
MKNLSKNFVWALVILMALSVLYSTIAGLLTPQQEISLSQVVEKINAGEVEEIVVTDTTLEVKQKNGEIVMAQKEPEAGLTETLRNFGVETAKMAGVKITVKTQSGFGFLLAVILPIMGPVLLIAFFVWFTARQVQRGSMAAFSFGQSRARLIGPEGQRERITFKDVAGVKEAKEELKEIVDFLKNPKKYVDIGAKIPKGVLLMGPPGSGKTMLAKAVSGESGVPFFHMSASEFIEMFVGVGASRTRDLFRIAKKAAPSIIFIDELDAVGRIRGTGLGGGHDEREQTLNQILVEMDGMETDTRVIVMGATNRPDVLDPALLRPGRFDRRVVLDLPDINDREEILKIHAHNKPLAEDVRLRVIAERTPGFSGADLANLVNEAAILAARGDKKQVAQLELVNSIEKVLLGPERKSHLLSPQEKKISAYHEAGHALVAASLEHADPVHKVSIVSRGRAAGYTLKLPLEDRHLYSRAHLIDELASALGGYAAEKFVFGDVTTGPHDDLKKATDVARSLVMRFGMSDAVGPVALGEREEMVFLGRELTTERNYSEQTAELIDREIKRLMEDARQTATEIVKRRRDRLDAIAAVLMEKETIEHEQFDTIVKENGEKKK